MCWALLFLQYNCVTPKTSIDDAMEEAKMVTCGAIEGLLKKQGEGTKAMHLQAAAEQSGSSQPLQVTRSTA